MTVSLQVRNGIYHAYIRYLDKDGQWRTTTKSTKIQAVKGNKRKAEQVCSAILDEFKTKFELKESEMLFSDFMKLWLEETRHTIKENTYYSYQQTVYNSICPYFEKQRITLNGLKPFHIQDFFTFKMKNDEVSANTIHHYYANISKALKYALKTERIKSNPASKDKIELPKKEKHIGNYYSSDELKELLSHIVGTKLEPVVFLGAWFGLRRGEVIGLRWQDIDFDNKILTVNGTITDKGESGSKINNLRYVSSAKTSTSLRSFPLHDAAIEYLSKLKAQQDKRKAFAPVYNHKWAGFVCVQNNGDLIPLEYVSRTFPTLCTKCGLRRLTFHELRHTNITLLLNDGATMKELQEWAGHSSYSTTANIYAHVYTESKHRLSESIANMLH